jgi:hypothetical protein
MKDALAALAVPVRALVIALLGAGWAWLWFNGYWWAALLLAAVMLGIGISLDRSGERRLPDEPQQAITRMEWWVLVPMVTAGAAAAVTIIVTVQLTLPQGIDTELKETVGAVSAAITSFLAAGFVDWAADDKDSRLSDRIKGRFQTAYRDPIKYPDNTSLVRYVYSANYGGADGWGRQARHLRADGIAKYLREAGR